MVFDIWFVTASQCPRGRNWPIWRCNSYRPWAEVPTPGATKRVGEAGSAADSLIESGGSEWIYSGGAATGDTVQSGGLLGLVAGGTLTDETVRSGVKFGH